MKRCLLALALFAAVGAAQAHGRDAHFSCDIDSRYDFSTYRNAFVFEQKQESPHRITLGGGRLYIDGREAQLSEGDRARLREFETELRRLMPEVQHVTSEAVEIAFTALDEVARALSSHPKETIAKLDKAHALAQRELRKQPSLMFSKDREPDIDAIIEPILADFVPEVTGGAVSMAMKAVFADDKERAEIQARMERMKDVLEVKVDARAKQLEPLAEAMCQRMERMDSIDNALEYRLPNGDRIEFLKVRNRKTSDVL